MRSRCLNVSRKWRHTIFNILLMSFICLSVHGTAHASSAGSPLNVDGSNAQTQGSYNLTSGTISYPAENIGINYSAYMVQGANTTNNIYGDLGIGLNSGSTGYYTLNGGNLNISGNIVGGLGTSNFNIDGGSLNGISGNNFAGNITVTGLTIGVSGTGSFTQAAPTVVSANYYNVGYNSGSQGSYALNSGQLSATTGKIGVNGTGTFNQTGGIQTTTNINVGMNAGSQGTYTLSGNSVLNTQNMVIGSSGTGNFTQSGGGFNTTAFNLGLNEGSVGTYTQTGGILSNFDANGVSGYEVIGVNGVGT